MCDTCGARPIPAGATHAHIELITTRINDDDWEVLIGLRDEVDMESRVHEFMSNPMYHVRFFRELES